MKAMYRLELQSLLLATALCAPIVHAQDVDPNGPQISENTGNIATYLNNLGTYLGYNLSQTPQTPISPLVSTTVSQLLPSTSSGGSTQLPFFALMVETLFGAIPVNALSQQFVPSSGSSSYSSINTYANTTFKSYNSTSSTQQSTPSVSTAIDQQTYQQDPVSQAVLNILGTPDYSYCMSSDPTPIWNGGDASQSSGPATQYPTCQYLNEYQVMSNVIGTLPTTYQYYSYCYNQQFLNQLNSNTLIAPLMYSTDAPSSNQNGCQSSTNQSSGSTGGLTAQNQLQEAANFIRYVTGSVNPGALPQLKNYDALYAQATAPNTSNATIMNQKILAQANLVNYFSKLRSYAAQSSVAYSNFYYIFSKRIPQTPAGQSGASASPTSQALTEFTMATWRLFSPDGSANSAWLNQINQASTASVQKEIVTLLAEINYQLYLTRQQQERMLLTENMLLLLNTRTSQPIPPTNSASSTLQSQ